jgi:predicted double-glycine peptidase
MRYSYNGGIVRIAGVSILMLSGLNIVAQEPPISEAQELPASSPVINIKNITPDRACGPRCLIALMKLTGAGKADCDVDSIYGILGKPALSPTSLGDLKTVAEHLGFSAAGYRCSTADLAVFKDYLILPVGKGKATADNPAHFILVSVVTAEFGIVIDPYTLKPYAIELSEIKEQWNGQALVISAGKDMPPLRKPTVVDMDKRRKFDDLKDFGRVRSGTQLSHTFIVRKASEAGGAPKIIGKSCSCLSATLAKNDSGDATLTVQLNVEQSGTQQVQVAVGFEANDLIKRYQILVHGANIIEPVLKQVYIAAPDGGTIEHSVSFDYYTDAKGILMFDRIKTDLPNLKVISSTVTRYVRGEDYVINVKMPLILQAGSPAARIQSTGTVDFVFQTELGERSIPVIVTLDFGHDSCIVTPARLFIVVSKSGSSIDSHVQLEFPINEVPDNIKLASPEVPFDLKSELLKANLYKISITLSPENVKTWPLGLKEGNLRASFQYGKKDTLVDIPTAVFVRE